MTLDFTMDKYCKVCISLLDNQYVPVTVASYLEGKYLEDRTVVLRHDVDRRKGNALKMARLEKALGIHSTYYFRYPYTFDRSLIKSIADLGHEVGYHYEDLSKTKGDYSKAIQLFEEDLSRFKEISDIRTISMHGDPSSPYDNRDLWKKYNFHKYHLIGDASLSLNNIFYLSDAGRTWNRNLKIRDYTMSNVEFPIIYDTDNLIEVINNKNYNTLYLSFHPERWSSNGFDWIFSFFSDFVFNVGKFVLRSRAWKGSMG